jgi:uncharacterized protein YeaO (DUF488 family)
VAEVKYRRIYDDVAPHDGHRVLVDRIWPRGIRKADAHIDEWLRDIAPSTELRQWFGHEPDRFDEFRRRYLAELDDPERQRLLEQLRATARHQRTTLLTATRDVEHSQAAALAQWLNGAGHTAR